jgi:cytochrome c-type biogenesis protein CcmE
MENDLEKSIKIIQRQARIMNTIRKRRLAWVILLICSSLLATFFILQALRQNVNLFFTPTEVVAGQAKQAHVIRMGGMVQKGSLAQGKDLNIQFVLTDFAHSVTVKYRGILPDLFKEGQGVVVLGRLDQLQKNLFYADQVLAKHDENYMPSEVRDALKKGMAHKK